jgi:hypothetical protein
LWTALFDALKKITALNEEIVDSRDELDRIIEIAQEVV